MKLYTALVATAVFAATPALAAEGDADRGKGVYKKCAACHVLDKEKNKVGPHLVKIIDRKAGVVPKYRYSKALKKMADGGLVWTLENLDKYLTKPRDFIKRGKMAFAGLRDAQDRADVIAYLEKVGGKTE